MREILFRATRLDNGQWVYGYYVGDCGDGISEIVDTSASCAPRVAVDPATVGQYTGLKDKNGTKIFEGDILSVRDRDGEYRFIVRFGRCGGVANVEHPVGYMGYCLEGADTITKYLMRYGMRDDLVYWLSTAFDVEVTGNIWDNPELLEEADGSGTGACRIHTRRQEDGQRTESN